MYKEKELIIPLHKTIVRPHLEYCIQAWRPHRKKDIDMLEKVQRRTTKMIPILRNISYEMRPGLAHFSHPGKYRAVITGNYHPGKNLK